MKQSVLFAAGIIATGAFVGPAFAETRTYDMPEFDKIDISAGLKLVAEAGEAQSVTVETKDGDFDDIELKVKDGTLYITREWNRLRWHQKKADYKIRISARELNGIEASSGSHSVLKQINSRNFSIDQSSGSHVSVEGDSDDCEVDLSSGANMDARSLICDSANIDVSSGGHGEITVLVSLNGDASSGGHVSVYGGPSQVNIDRSSGGRIKLKSASHQAKRN